MMPLLLSINIVFKTSIKSWIKGSCY